MTMTALVAMLTAIAGVSVHVDGTAVHVFAEDFVLTDDWTEVAGALDEDAFDEVEEMMAESAVDISGDSYSGMVYDFGDFSVEIQYSSADI